MQSIRILAALTLLTLPAHAGDYRRDRGLLGWIKNAIPFVRHAW